MTAARIVPPRVRLILAAAAALAAAGAALLPGGAGEVPYLRVPAWYPAAALAAVFALAAVASWFPREGPRTRVLLRLAGFAGRYRFAILAVVGVGVVRSLAGLLRIPIGASVVDDVLVSPGAGARERLWSLAWAFVGVGVFMAVAGFLADVLLNRCGAAMLLDLRLSLGRALVHKPLSFFQGSRAGDLHARLDRDVGCTSDILRLSFDTVLVEPLVVAGAIFMAFAMNWRLAALLLAMPLVVQPLLRISRRIRERAEKRQVLGAEMSQALLQVIAGIKVVKAFRGESREIERLEGANRRFSEENLRVLRLFALSRGVLEALQVVGTAGVMVLGGYLVLGGQVTLGEMTAFMGIVTVVYKSGKDVIATVNRVNDSLPGAARAFEILDGTTTVEEGTRVLPAGPLASGIRFEGVRFRYLENEVLRGLDLDIPAGRVVAVVGPTGAGKTTLCDLVARFYDPTGGRVLVDGVDARDYTMESLRRAVAIVPQDAFLFNATVEENIAYGKPGATRAEVVAAARAACIHDEIEAMEGGYGRVLGERGTTVSGGQRQRIAIARALLADAPVLILDEATSSLDSPSEARVQEALGGLVRGRTVIVVAHRLSTVRHADLVVVMGEGRIVEAGPPADLLAGGEGRFRDLFEGQHRV